MKIKKVVFVTNFYINTTPSYPNNFDHPFLIEDLKKIPIYKKMLKAFEEMEIPPDVDVKFLFFAMGSDAQPLTREKYIYGYCDGKIKKELNNLIENYNINYELITNTTLNKIPKIEDYNLFLKSQDYGSIRNLGFVFANIYDVDLLIQIDSDEIVPKQYLKTVINTIENSGVNMISGFYIEHGSVLPSAEDTLQTWPKFSYMSEDIKRLTQDHFLKPALYAKGGNMVFTKKFFSQICYPHYVIRGEDFSLILLSWLIYKNGNDKVGILPNNEIFKTYFLPSLDIAVQHYPIKQANKNQLLYLFKNLLRFSFDRNAVFNQDKLSLSEINSLGRYMFEMIKSKDYISFVNRIFEEVSTKFSSIYKKETIDETKNLLLRSINEVDKRNFFEEYKEYQKRYINFIKKLKEIIRPLSLAN